MTDGATATLITTVTQSGPTTAISISGTLDGVSASIVTAYLLDQVAFADRDCHLDLGDVKLVDDAQLGLVTALHRVLAVRGHHLHLSTSAHLATPTATFPPLV